MDPEDVAQHSVLHQRIGYSCLRLQLAHLARPGCCLHKRSTFSEIQSHNWRTIETLRPEHFARHSKYPALPGTQITSLLTTTATPQCSLPPKRLHKRHPPPTTLSRAFY